MSKSEHEKWLNGLNDEDLAFIKRFLLASGSLKDLAKAYGITYPTIRVRLDRLIEKIKVYDAEDERSAFERTTRALFADGKIDAETLKTILTAHETELNHAVGGEIRYSDVAGTGFVEMWTHCENGAHYFSRTRGEAGPMAKLSGTSEWRPFLLPFFGEANTVLSKLQINLMLPGGGTVEFRNVALYQLPRDGVWRTSKRRLACRNGK